jgi:nucleoside-diphosphate-sugar epimerase
MPKQVVVFGGSGFIGTHLIRRLVKEPDTTVVSVDLLPPRETLEGCTYQIGDVRDLSSFAVDGAVERIYNFAAVHRTPGHPNYAYYETNIAGAIEVTKYAERVGCDQIIFTSSISVYGPSEETKDETAAPAPNSAYGYSKLLAERVHRAWWERLAARRLTVVRPAVVFGAGERGNFTRMAGLLRRGIFVYPGRTDTIKACIYVEDLLDVIEYARTRPEPYVLFNGSYPHRYTIRQIVDTFRKMYFPRVYTIKIPLWTVLFGARLLRALDLFHIGIHTDRVYKLVRSTDVVPGWLTKQGLHKEDALERALERWFKESSGTFV